MSADPNLASSNSPNGEISTIPTHAEIARERTAAHQRSLNTGSPPPNPNRSIILLLALAIVIIGLVINQFWLILAGSIVAILLSVQILFPTLKPVLIELVTEQDQGIFLGTLGLVLGVVGLAQVLGLGKRLGALYQKLDWDAIGALGEVFGALGQILIAILAVYIAWRQYVISKDLTIQQNTITQQQTIDTYFQGISDLVLDEEGLLEDWPQERAIAEGRTAAILSSVDGSGKAKIIRFLSRAKLLSPLKRDQRLGRAILDGSGGYAEDRLHGIRVIDLGVMLAAADLSGTDLRWVDLSEANLIRVNLTNCDLVKTNFTRTVLCGASLRGADLSGTRFFYGKVETASPRSRTEPPNFKTGMYTGAVVENADFTGVEDMSEEQRYYCCAWGGTRTRGTIPGGCEGIPNKLGR
ncbi:pentapeptide repeat-containing protein [Leptolyngbya sp. GGD]|uniref:pentapeptide repeat-containing protein n=1 Tax=Leptolyngbya sp. GGD TaxID=2997907 RepID=UPI00227C0E70|nr:pentapeptide repeat-containing protein [Leptolyngbya sp. GGD]MCY6491170.1 pentapeptide repeat-containing protein [Leptolyngbya sp. GGD]